MTEQPNQQEIDRVNDLIKKVGGVPPMIQWREKMRQEEGDQAADDWYEGLDG